MAMAALSPSSVLATPIQVNPQVRADLQAAVPQAAQDAQKSVKTAQTDTVTISAQALKMADSQYAAAEKDAAAADEQEAARTAAQGDNEQSEIQRNAVRAYAEASRGQ